MKKQIRLSVLIMGLAVFVLVFAGADPALAAKKKAPKIKKTEYEGGGKVDVDFKYDVEYGKTKVKVKDSSGKVYKAVITEKDEDDLDFTVKNIAPGKKYTFRITKVRREGTKKYYTVKGSFKVPASKKAKVKKVEFDEEDSEVSFEFRKDVTWKDPRVMITADEKDYVVKILEKDEEEIEVRVKGLKKGTVYRYKITGAAPYGPKNYKTITGKFTA